MLSTNATQIWLLLQRHAFNISTATRARKRTGLNACSELQREKPGSIASCGLCSNRYHVKWTIVLSSAIYSCHRRAWYQTNLSVELFTRRLTYRGCVASSAHSRTCWAIARVQDRDDINCAVSPAPLEGTSLAASSADAIPDGTLAVGVPCTTPGCILLSCWSSVVEFRIRFCTGLRMCELVCLGMISAVTRMARAKKPAKTAYSTCSPGV